MIMQGELYVGSILLYDVLSG